MASANHCLVELGTAATVRCKRFLNGLRNSGCRCRTEANTTAPAALPANFNALESTCRWSFCIFFVEAAEDAVLVKNVDSLAKRRIDRSNSSPRSFNFMAEFDMDRARLFGILRKDTDNMATYIFFVDS
jgi:hypothetical protein